jgi:Tfp pilus assembly protein PilF
MISFSIRFTPSAQIDLQQARYFYSQMELELGQLCADSLMLDIERLRFLAGIHPKIKNYHRMIARSFPFSIYYQLIGKEVVITAVLDNRRNPQGLFKRLSTV